VSRHAERGAYDKKTIYEIIDNTIICHAGIAIDGNPVVIPIIHGRVGDRIFLHGAHASRLLQHITTGNTVCLTFTIIDALVLAKSVFHHSMNYRSVVAFGTGGLVETDQEKLKALQAISEHVLAGRWEEVRPIAAAELNATSVIYIDIHAASAKQRSGLPVENENDLALPYWSGLFPLSEKFSTPQPADDFSRGAELPKSVLNCLEKQSS
jgi:nitroimidazol reductase NimA-like FMN-containing flavoprotein (pyridoxamine 5'-phosphate oxidase superfamily)